jgi:hypothetical protein
MDYVAVLLMTGMACLNYKLGADLFLPGNWRAYAALSVWVLALHAVFLISWLRRVVKGEERVSTEGKEIDEWFLKQPPPSPSQPPSPLPVGVSPLQPRDPLDEFLNPPPRKLRTLEERFREMPVSHVATIHEQVKNLLLRVKRKAGPKPAPKKSKPTSKKSPRK